MQLDTSPWPALPADSWTATRETLHCWLQIVGKTSLALQPMLNQWWQVALVVTPQGLTTGPMPYAGGQCEVIFDFQACRLRLLTGDGQVRELALEACPVAEFYQRYRALLRQASIDVKIWPVPVELADTTPFPADQHHGSYDPAPVATYWQILQAIEPVMQAFRSGFTGKASPLHLFWGGFDFSLSRYSGRAAPPHPSTPHLSDVVTRLAYAEEVYEVGWWPGGGGHQPAFFSYLYPSPSGFAQAAVRPAAAYFDSQLGEFLLPYEAVRTSTDPAQAVHEFMQSTYEAAATLSHWDRLALERTAGFPTSTH